ncbi:hypothetical protein AAFG13_18195 [Bradyrhizobium sp. B124]|uniref:hypothetical protein n=1 Tax=Bradyrhizobium sp. B124 TaxID=3140245 RepID=UPI0031838C7A
MSAVLCGFQARLFELVTLVSIGSLATAHAQSPADLFRQFDRTINSAVAEANQSRWERLPTTELVCIDRALQRKGSSLSIVVPNLQPTDPRLAEIRSHCRPASGPPAPDGLASLPKPSVYAVDGLALGGKVNFQSSAYAQYDCQASNSFPGFTWCQKAKHDPDPRGPTTTATSILHAEDGTAVYVNRSLKPAFLRATDAQAEITRLSAKYGSADVRRATDPSAAANSVIATFGEVTLKPLTEPEVQLAATGRQPRDRIPFDFFGDFQRSAQNGLPVFWIHGGSGFVWSASFDANGRGHLRFAAVDGRSFTKPFGPVDQASSDSKAGPGRTSPPPSNGEVGDADNSQPTSTQTAEPFYIGPSVRIRSRTPIGTIASSDAICALLNHPLFSRGEVETGYWKSVADLDPDHSGKQWIVAHLPPEVREPQFVSEIDNETAAKAEANLRICLQKLVATNARAPAAVKRILIPNLNVVCFDPAHSDSSARTNPTGDWPKRRQLQLQCIGSTRIDTTRTDKSSESFLMLTMMEAQPTLRTLLDRADQALQTEIAAKQDEQRKLDNQKSEDRLRLEQIQLKQKQDLIDQQAARQNAEQLRLEELRQVAAKMGPEYANKRETEWSISSKIDEMTDKAVLTAYSRQGAAGVVAEIKISCGASGLAITALVVDQAGKPTVELPTMGGMPGNPVVGQMRLNDEPPSPAGFFPASDFRNELSIPTMTAGQSLADGIYWRVYASIPTDKGQLFIKIPIYAPQIQEVIKSCPPPH